MIEGIKALLVQAGHDPLDDLRMALEKQSITIITAKNCAQAALALWSGCPPHLVFTEVQLTDGNWADVLTLTGSASAPVNVIVVAPFVDVGFYVQAIERGAFDFIVLPLSDLELEHVVRIAAENVLTRRREHAALSPSASRVAALSAYTQSEHAFAGAED